MRENKLVNDVTKELMESMPKFQIRCRLKEILAEVGLSLVELSLLTGIRYSSLNQLANNAKDAMNKNHLIPICIALRISDFNELFEIVITDNRDEETEYMREQYKMRKYGVSDEMLEKIKDNAERLGRTKELKKRY